MFHKTKNKNKKWFRKSRLQCFSSENILIKHKENCLSINGKQSVKLEERIIKFGNYFKQIPVPFKIYADFECNFKKVKCNESSYTEKYQDQLNQLLYIEAKMQPMNLLKQFLKNINIVKDNGRIF